jgi:signal transduction histidine kinase/DNA-binding response OmpR family regulator
MQITGDPPNDCAETSQAKILIVDDRPDKLLAFQSILDELGQQLFTARSGEEALKLVLEHEFAVILLDVNMPGLDGLETAALIRQRKRTAHTPIIFITAYSDEMLTMQGYSLGAVDYILAPVIPEILRTKVKVFVDLFCVSQIARRQAEERIALAREQAARTAAEQSNRRSSFLAEASRALSQSLDFQATVEELFSLTVPALVDVCFFTPIDVNGRIGRTEMLCTIVGEYYGKTSRELLPVNLLPSIEIAIATRQPLLIEKPRTTEALSPTDPANGAPVLPIRSGAAFPLLARGRLAGILCFAVGYSDRTFNDYDWSLLEDVAGRAASALDNAFLYQQLQKADHQKSEFLAMLGHELRNPLAPIRNAVEVLATVRSDPNRLNWVQSIIQRQVNHLTRLVNDLLDISRITRGKIELQVSSLDACTVVSAAVETSLPLIESRKHHLILSVPEEKLWIRADPDRLAQVMANLLNNAAKYTPEGGQISLSLSQEANEVVFRVVDTGVGFSPEISSTLFDLFAQGERSPGSLHEGLGIGLTLVRRLVELHRGSVSAHSAGPNKGSQFVVRLPVGIEAIVESVNALDQEPYQVPPKNLRVLVVDDNKDAADSIGLLLQLEGFEVQLAYDGFQALELVSDYSPDAVLLDIGLPLMDGYEVARRIRAQPSGKQVILIAGSGFGREEDRQRSADAGFDSHLTKPFDPQRLSNLLVTLCRRKA